MRFKNVPTTALTRLLAGGAGQDSETHSDADTESDNDTQSTDATESEDSTESDDSTDDESATAMGTECFIDDVDAEEDDGEEDYVRYACGY